MLNIQNRRYLGNKYKLLDFIEETIKEHCPGVESLFDVFSGTGVVAYHFMDRMKIVTNDILYSNYMAHVAFMSKDKFDAKKISETIDMFNGLDPNKLEDNYMSTTFGNTYFSYDDCKKIGFAREYINQEFSEGRLNERERSILITVIMYSMDRIANTCGHYDAYRKGAGFEKNIVFLPLDLNKKAKTNNIFYNGDSNQIVTKKDFPSVDCVYCDPPYNSRNYCDMYHVLENVAKWEKPDVSGVAKKMDRKDLKSKYCSKNAADAFEDLIEKLKCKYIILSYNNTGNNANDRSNARMSDDDIIRILSKKGTVSIYSKKYKAFSTGKSENNSNEERLFVCTVNQNRKKETIKSPLNYTGGKTKLLPQLLAVFPKNIDTFYDLFCGGANVGVNIQASKVIYNDINKDLTGLLEYFSIHKPEDTISRIIGLIDEFGLSKSDENGYEAYGCRSSTGLGAFNRNGYLALRNDFNNLTIKNDEYYLKLFTLIVFSFNNQIRFNKDHCFNLPVGKRDFNKNIKLNLTKFSNALNSQSNEFSSVDFREINIEKINVDDFVYCDPPYLITTAGYNEQKGWTEKDEKDLLAFLDSLNERRIRFALSNVMIHKGLKNKLLIEWSKKYTVHDMSFSYKNSNYHSKNRNQETKEVLITNY